MTYRPDPGFQVASQSSRTDPIAPVEDKPVAENVVDTTNLAVAVYPYPSATGVAMVPHKDLSFTGKLITAAGGTVNVTVWGINDDDLVTGDWINVTPSGYRTDDNTVGNAAITSTGAVTTLFALDFDNFNYDYYKVEVDVLVSAVNTVIIKQRRKAI